jgi:hypothetical protein
MNSPGLIIGPWIGEFGWELFSWQAYARSIARRFDKVVVISRPGNEYLYSDFSDFYLPFNPPSEGISDSHMNSSVKDFNVQEFLMATLDREVLNSHSWAWLPPTKIGNPPYEHWRSAVEIPGFGSITPSYKLYKGKCQSDYADIIIHARNREIRKQDNWPEESWQNLVRNLSSGYKIISIGTPGSSLHIEGTSDYRGSSLEVLTGLMKTAKCIVGPSSGPLHLATLCGCPQIWWTSNPQQNYGRYTEMWNPFLVESVMLNSSNPDAQDVVDTILNFL